jgi:hypothetical protein
MNGGLNPLISMELISFDVLGRILLEFVPIRVGAEVEGSAPMF